MLLSVFMSTASCESLDAFDWISKRKNSSPLDPVWALAQMSPSLGGDI